MQTSSTTKTLCHRDANSSKIKFFLISSSMAKIEGELGTLLRVDMAGLALFGVSFFGMALFFLCYC